ncbi:MAG: RNA polymerase sigma-70 factor [Niastella sp.]|nr:RNA polymerase sigma-70 factor [Niastella sp.]
MSGSVKHIKLFDLIGKGDEIAFQQVFRHYTPRLHPFIFKVVKSEPVAEGIVQQVFLKLWENRVQVASKSDPSAWLFTVAAHLSFNYLKKMSVQQRYIDYVKRTMEEGANTPEAEKILSSKENQGVLYRAIEQLPPQRQYIFKLSRIEGLTHKEIAEKLQISPITVKNQLVAALDFLRKQLQKNDALLLIMLSNLHYQFF